MAVRKGTARQSTNSVHGRVNGINFHLFRDDCYETPKSVLYSKLKSIKNGTLKVDIPLKCMWHTSLTFFIRTDNSVYLKFSY